MNEIISSKGEIMFKEKEEQHNPDIMLESINTSFEISDTNHPQSKIRNILIIEPVEETRNAITYFLQNEHYQVIQAANNQEGIKLYRHRNPDFILWNIDLILSNENEIQNKICYIEKKDHTPLIILADKPSYSDFRKVMELGADDYMCKPYNVSFITQAIKRLFARYENLRIRTESQDEIISRNELNESIVIKYCGKIIPISTKSILFISIEKHYSEIYTENNKRYVIKKSLRKWEQILPENQFVRIHRSTLVNINKIKEIKRVNNHIYNVYMHNSNIKLELTRNYFKNLNKYAAK
jgi:DNA-binding LytR/AlgR family response regulator